jgi:cytochrome b561
MTEIKKYPKPIIALHWLTFILLIVVFVFGKALEDYEFTTENFNHYRKHALLGMLILVLTIIRFVVKRKYKNSLPPEINYYSEGHKKVVNIVNRLLYVFLIITPLIGFVMIFQTGAMQADLGGPFPEGAHFNEALEALHKGAVFGLISLIITHVVGVVMYKLKTGENLVRRICKFMK